MLFKVDENLHADAAQTLRQYGHDALTVFDQGLRGYGDSEVARVCQREYRAIITLDLDFSDVRAYPPANYSGIVVLRLADQSRAAVLRVMQRIIPLLDQELLAGRLWIVDEHRVRIRGADPTRTIGGD
jgi:predicted nuclease of predicted toxin-antitoxin system